MSRIRSFKDLDVWKRGMILAREVYGATGGYPSEERYGLAAETRKTARSIPANVAEGKMRLTPRDFRKFVGIALGSAGELQTQLCMAADAQGAGEVRGGSRGTPAHAPRPGTLPGSSLFRLMLLAAYCLLPAAYCPLVPNA